MISVMLMVESRMEKGSFVKAIESLKVHCIMTEPSYANYVKALQYMPDIILMEIPRKSARQFHFIQMLKQHHTAKSIPVICFGDPLSEEARKGMERIGVSKYFERPLNMVSIIEIIKARIRQKEKIYSQQAAPKQTLAQKDIEALLSSRTPPQEKIRLMTGYVSGLMAFPFTVSKIIQLTNNSDTGAGDLAKVIESDPVVSTNILKICNSVLFASSNRRISSIKDAVVRIGFSETRRIVMSMSVMRIFDASNGNLGFNRLNFWLHCLTTAIISEHIAKKMGDVNSDEAFLAGLLHDFGIILMDEFFSPIFNRLLELTTDRAARFIETEKEVLGITHVDVTSELFKQWKMPDSIREGILGHYTILNQNSFSDEPANRLALCAAMGNTVAKVFSFGTSCDQYISPIQNWAFQKAKLPFGFRQNYTELINHDLALYQEFLKMRDEGKSPSGTASSLARIGVVNLTEEVFIPAEAYLAERGHVIIHITPDSGLKDIDPAPDIVIVNTDGQTNPQVFSEALTVIRQSSKTPAQGKNDQLAVLAFLDRSSPHCASPESPRFSFMHRDFDLRQLDENIAMIMEGEHVTPGQSKPRDGRKPAPAAHSALSQNLYISVQNATLSTAVSRLQKECSSKGIKNKESDDGETLAITAQFRIKSGLPVEANWMLQLAELYLQKALIRHESELNAQKIETVIKMLSEEQKVIYERLLKK